MKQIFFKFLCIFSNNCMFLGHFLLPHRAFLIAPWHFSHCARRKMHLLNRFFVLIDYTSLSCNVCLISYSFTHRKALFLLCSLMPPLFLCFWWSKEEKDSSHENHSNGPIEPLMMHAYNLVLTGPISAFKTTKFRT